MSERNFSIEMNDPEAQFKNMASKANHESLNPRSVEIKELYKQYNLLMEQYSDLVVENPVDAENILKEANAIHDQLDELESRNKSKNNPNEVPSMKNIEEQAKSLTIKYNKPKEKLN